MSKAGHLFVCSCCGGSFPEERAMNEVQLGPVCEECYQNSKWAEAFLRKAKITRPFGEKDFTPENKNRILS